MEYEKLFFKNKIDLKEYYFLRRKLHQYPELSLKEYQTKSIILEAINALMKKHNKKLQIIHCENTGFFVDFKGKNKTIFDHPYCISFRAELDALPIEDKSWKEWSSKFIGVSHSCGHEGHCVVLVALIEFLLLNEEKISRDFAVRLIFQPGEETFEGAQLMIKEGCLEKVNEIYAFHNHSESLGLILVTDGIIMARADFFKILLNSKDKGLKSNHSSACCFIINMINMIKNDFDSKELLCISITKVNFEEKNECEISGSFRCVDDKIGEKISKKIKQIVENIANLFVIEYNIEISYCPKLNNDLSLAKFVENICKKNNLNVMNVKFATPILGSDDFSRYCEEIPGVYFGIGGKDETYYDINPHASDFDFNDRIIPYALEVFIRIIEEKSNTYLLS